jgi:hypothetical protein
LCNRWNDTGSNEQENDSYRQTFPFHQYSSANKNKVSVSIYNFPSDVPAFTGSNRFSVPWQVSSGKMKK